MEQRELHLQSLGICHRLYHFIMKALSSQALKTVTLGHPVHCGSTQFPTCKATLRDSGSNEDDNNLRMENDRTMTQENPPLPSEEKALKKMVSINENVEHIIPSKMKKKQPIKNSNSLDQEKHEEGEQKPLRSNTEVGSDLNGKSNSKY